MPTSCKCLETDNDTNLQNQCALPAIPSFIPDSRSYDNVSAAISVIDDHSHNARPLAFAPNALSLGDPHVWPKDLGASNTSMRASSVLPLAAPSRSPPLQAKPKSESQPSVSAPPFLASDFSALTFQAFQFKEQQLLPTASLCVPGTLSPSLPSTSASHFTPPQLTVQTPALPSFSAFLSAMLHPSALPLSDPHTSLPMFQATPVAECSPSASSRLNIQLLSSDDSSSGGFSNRSKSIGNSTTCQPPDKPSGDSEYYQNKEKHLQFCDHESTYFSRYRGDPEVATSNQIRIINKIPTRRRNRLKTGFDSSFTLTEAKRYVSNDKQLDQLEESVENSCPSVEVNGLAVTSNLYVSISTPLSKSTIPSITSDTNNLPARMNTKRTKTMITLMCCQDFLSHRHKQATT